MIKTIKRAFVLGMTSLILFTGLPATTVNAADSGRVHTETKVSDNSSNPVVTYVFKMDKTKVTDGRIAVTYDPAVLTFAKAKSNVQFDDRDYNKEYKEGDRAGVSYAFVNDGVKYVKGDIFTLTFNVNPGAEYQETVLKTNVFQIDNGEEEIITNLALEDAVEVGRPTLAAPTNLQVEQTATGVKVTWDKNAAADGYTVYRAGSDGEYRVVGTATGTSFSNLWVNKNRTYYYKVKAFQKQGKEKVYSEDSEVVSIKVK